mgnify:CR=1 FL=1
MTDRILYTREGCLPTPLPNMIVLSSGAVRTGFDYTDEEIADAGWTVAPQHPGPDSFDYRTHRVVWNSETSEWDTVAIPESDIEAMKQRAWNGIRHERNEYLKDSDYIVVKSLERGESIPTAWSTYRQALRDITTSVDDPRDVIFPERPE